MCPSGSTGSHVGAAGQALELVSDVHLLADRVRVKVAGAKTPERGALISPRPSGAVPSPNRADEHAVRGTVFNKTHTRTS